MGALAGALTSLAGKNRRERRCIRGIEMGEKGKPKKTSSRARHSEPSCEDAIAKTTGPRSPRNGQLDASKARFDLGAHERVIGEALGTPPPGYGLTLVRGFVRDPRTLLAVWDINDEEAVAAIEDSGLDRLELRVLGEGGAVLRRVRPAKRGGAYQVDLAVPGCTVWLEIGLRRDGEVYECIARSSPLRMPPEEQAVDEATESVAMREDFDRSVLSKEEISTREAQVEGGHLSPAARLRRRLAAAEAAMRSSKQAGSSSGEPRGATPSMVDREECRGGGRVAAGARSKKKARRDSGNEGESDLGGYEAGASAGRPVVSQRSGAGSKRSPRRHSDSDHSSFHWPGSPSRGFGRPFRE